MRAVFLLISLLLGYCKVATAQNTTKEIENYKHTTSIHQKNSSTFNKSDSISLHNQKTHKPHTRLYIVAPSDSFIDRDVQGKKKKANYKNQFN